MRITGGRARGVPLQVPKGELVRPATDGLRQSVFSSLSHRLPGARFLDLFAGSGSYGLEALSRGAATGVAVERNPRALTCLRLNRAAVAKSVGVPEGTVEVIPVDVLHWKPTRTGVFDLVFIDPPYEEIPTLAPALFRRLEEWLVESPDPVIVFEMPGELQLTDSHWREVKRIGRGGGRQPAAVFMKRIRVEVSTPGEAHTE